ncbi:MAG: polyribonucleotide nucleotidyltransferase [Desulfonatronovibrio sp.]
MENTFKTNSTSASAGDRQITFETGKLANQADGAVVVRGGDTVVLVTAVTQTMQHDPGYFPLVVNYQEMSYASGRIPGSYFKREIGRPSDRETLVSRLIDRPIRPLFPKTFKDEVQVIATVLSADPQNDPDVLAISGASAALHISRIPFSGPIAGARIGYIDEEFVLNPSHKLLEQSDLNLIVAATRDGVVMVEGFTEFLPEKLIADAINWGQQQIIPLIDAQEELRSICGVNKITIPSAPEKDPELEKMVSDLVAADLSKALFIPEKMERRDAKREVSAKFKETIAEQLGEDSEKLPRARQLYEELEKKIVRERILESKTRIDGRDLTTVRPLTMEVGLLPRTHGSAIFARGETKSLCVTTLGSSSDEQRIETLTGDSTKSFMLHYNFPPYCVGEAKFLRGPSRREIGHGILAERALTPILPSAEDFPFTIRIVSEVMESNGSSSMATVCGGTLSLMDAGVPIKQPVAGIAMGLIREEDEYLVLTDILGDEDHLGDMDFKIAGTYEGVTAVQMDIKIPGIPIEVMYKALEQASVAKKTILDSMNKILDKPRSELSKFAPKTEVVYVDTDKIKDVIGPSGKNIKAITAETGSSIDIEDTGKITVFSPTQEILEKTREMILFFNQKAELGKDYEGEVKRILDFGAVVEILPGVDGLVHISQLDTKRIDKVSDVVNIGDKLKVKVIEIGDRGKVRLSRAAVLMEERGEKFDLESASRPAPRGRGGDRGRPNRGR